MESLNANEIRIKFLEFFRARGHAVVPSSSLVPADPSVLLTTAGMQQFKRYYTGEADPVRDFGSKNTASVQKSFRTSDIDEVGDETHLTFFEMLGNFSFGGYFKREAIAFAREFITGEMGLEISYVTVFEGSAAVPKDEESKRIWKTLDPQLDVREQGMEDVFWGPTGSSGPCGPTTEIYVRNAAGQDVEIWNIVFNQFFYPGSREELLAGVPGKSLQPLKTPGVDTGMGLERLAMVSQGKDTVFETDLFSEIVGRMSPDLPARAKRIAADHVRAVAFLVSDGVRPANKGAGYALRRLLRRVIMLSRSADIGTPPEELFQIIQDRYAGFPDYGNLGAQAARETYAEEYGKFMKTVETGTRELRTFIGGPARAGDPEALARQAFDLYQSYGLPIEVFIDEFARQGRALDVPKLRAAFDGIFEKHQEISRASVEKKFGGHGLVLDTGELKAGSEEELRIVTRLHTATHLLNAALRKVLGDAVRQAGSDITPERTRFDFTFPRKVTPEEIGEIEELVNYAVKKNFPVAKETMPLADAKRSGALYMERARYPDPVSVYIVGNGGEQFSKELCGGPHVAATGEIGRFRILKEESSSAGVRRIRAVVE